MARPGWQVRRRQQVRLVLEAIGMLVAAIAVVTAVWFYAAVAIVVFTP